MYFHFEEADGIGPISALIVFTKLKVHLDFLYDKQASELVERFAKKKRGKTVIAKGINFFQSILNIKDKGTQCFPKYFFNGIFNQYKENCISIFSIYAQELLET